MAFSDLISDVRRSWRRVTAVFTDQEASSPLRPDTEEQELSPDMRTSLDQRADQVMDEYEEDFRRLAD